MYNIFKSLEYNEFLGVKINIWIDLQCCIEILGFTIEEYVDLLKSYNPTNLPEVMAEAKKHLLKLNSFDEWNW